MAASTPRRSRSQSHQVAASLSFFPASLAVSTSSYLPSPPSSASSTAMTDDLPPVDYPLHILHVPLSDSDDQEILKYFEVCFDFIERARALDRGILIHCRHGLSRSP